MNKYMKMAIDLAIKNVDQGGTPYGSVIVKNDEILGAGVNTLHIHPDISGHAELIAIREAQEKLNTVDLSGCTVYASGHPCPMCFGAIVLSGIKEIVYFNSPEDAAEVGMPLTSNIYEYLKGNKDAIELHISKVTLDPNQINPMSYWNETKSKRK